MSAATDSGEMLVLDDSPRTAPAGFASPVVEPLSRPAAPAAPSPLGPLPRPDELTVQAGPALGELNAAPLSSRDPRQPFDDVQQLIATASGSRDPQAPFQVGSSGDPWSSRTAGAALDPTLPLLAPPSGDPYPIDSQPLAAEVGLGASIRATGWPMLIALVVGFVISPLSLLALLGAWMLSMLNPPTASALRHVYLGAVAVVVGVVFVALVSQQFDPMTLAMQWSRWLCLVLLIACPWIMHNTLVARARR